MSETFILTGRPERPVELQRAFEWFLENNVPAINYGGAWRNMIACGTVEKTNDLDFRADFWAWCRNMPPEVKRQFEIHEPHIRYLRKMRALGLKGDDGALGVGNIVLVLRSNTALTCDIGKPIELILVRRLETTEELAVSADLGFCQVADNGVDVHVTRQFMNDHAQRTMTTCCADSYVDLHKTHKRVQKFTCPDGPFEGWHHFIPDRFHHFFDLG